MRSTLAGVADDGGLGERIRALLAAEPGITERRMFGGLAFLVDGNMAVAASGRGVLMVRIHPTDAARLLDRPGARPMEMRGRPLRGWLEIDDAGVRTARQLGAWVRVGVGCARSLPAKADQPASS